VASRSTRTDEQRIAAAFAKVEEELISSMVRNLERHKVQEVAEGVQWAQWQALQLESLDRYARQNAIRQGRRFDRLNERIESLIAKEYAAAGMEQERAILAAVRKGWEAPRTPDLAFFEAPHERLDALVRATHSDLMRAEHAVLRRANDQYRQIIFDAQVYAQSGAGTYAKAVDMATRDFLAKGIDGIVYRNGARHTITDYASMCLRTSTKRAALVAEGDARTEWGVNTVVVDRRDDACPECMEWVGEVLVDDVYGSGTAEEAQRLGYSLLSEAMDAGLFHPNCRDTVSTWFPGVSDMPERPSRADRSRAEAREAAEQVENTAKNAEARYERLSEYSLDGANKERYAAKAEEWAEKAEAVEKASPTVVFEAAETIEEAQQFAMQFVDESAFSPAFKGQVSYKGLPVDVANEINRGLADAMGTEGMPKISGIKVVSPTSAQGKKAFSGADAIASYNFAEGGIYLNKDVLKSMGAWEAHVKEAQEAFDYVVTHMDELTGPKREVAERYAAAGRSLVEGDTVAGAVKHEIGHHVDWSVFGAKGNDVRNNWKMHADRISGYAGLDKREYMAESFVAWLNGETDRVAADFIEFLEDALAKLR
jgi:hypothetical protein